MPSQPQEVSAAALPPVTPHAMRDELTQMIVNDLLGPAGGPSEELDQREERVTGRYLVGMLAPRSTVVEAGGQDALGTDQVDDPEVGPSDKSTTSSDTFFPNSIGISFLVETETKAILIKSLFSGWPRKIHLFGLYFLREYGISLVWSTSTGCPATNG